MKVQKDTYKEAKQGHFTLRTKVRTYARMKRYAQKIALQCTKKVMFLKGVHVSAIKEIGHHCCSDIFEMKSPLDESQEAGRHCLLTLLT